MRHDTNGRHAARGRRAGFTLLEMVVFSGILAVLLLAMANAGDSASRLFSTSVARVDLEQDLRGALRDLRAQLERGSASSFAGLATQPMFATQVEFDVLDEVDGASGLPAWRTWRIELQVEPGETLDGTDEDGDGTIDERQLVLARDPGGAAEQTLVLTRFVPALFEGETLNGLDDNGNGLIDEPGFALYADGETVHVLLCVEGFDGEGRLVTRSMSTATRPRNP